MVIDNRPGETAMIHFDKPKLQALKKAYEKCKGESFIFEGHEILKSYAKYMIEYLETVIK